jgi:hypothetical protein
VISVLRKVMISVVVVTAAANVTVCQQAAEPQTVSVCELLSHPLAYSGLGVHVTGRLQGVALFAAGCSVDVHVNGRQWPLAILIGHDGLRASGLSALQSQNDTPYGPSSNLMVEVAGTFERMIGDVGFSSGNRRNDRFFAAKLSDVTVVSSRQERPKALSICEVLADPIRYHGQVIWLEGEHRWLQGDQILHDASCGPGGGAVLIPPPEKTDERPPPDTPLGVLRTSVDVIGKGRFEAWQPGVEGFAGDRNGFGNCGCYRGRLRFAGFSYFKLRTVPAQRP